MKNKVDEREIIKHAKNGDQDAITILYQENYYAVLGAIRSLIRDEDEAMDLLQETFICFSGRRPISDLKNRYGMNAVSRERIQSQSAITFSRNRIF